MVNLPHSIQSNTDSYPLKAANTPIPGQTQPNEPTGDLMDGSNEPSDFLSRERAALGADADQFSTPAGNSTTNGDDDDLLGGDSGGQVNGTASQEISDFQSSFPPVSSQNEVATVPLLETLNALGKRDDQI